MSVGLGRAVFDDARRVRGEEDGFVDEGFGALGEDFEVGGSEGRGKRVEGAVGGRGRRCAKGRRGGFDGFGRHCGGRRRSVEVCERPCVVVVARCCGV